MTCWLCGFQTTELATNAGPPMCKDGCQICAAVARVDEEIDQAVTALRRLLDKRCDLRTEQNRAHDPMHRLPVEIRRYTFELVLRRWDEWGDTIQVEGEGPRLSSVCRSWRDIAQSNPIFWSTIRIGLGKATSEWIDFVRDYIKRSGIWPLTFHITVVDRSESGLEQSSDDLATVLDTMGRCSNRLQSLSLDVPYSILRDFQHNNFSWHRLSQLRILSPYRLRNHINQPLSLMNPTASPERIDIRSVTIHSLRISWDRLTSAKIERLDFKDLTQLFQHAPQMTDCHISEPSDGPKNFSMPPIIHHKLKKLSLCDADDWEPTIILDSLTLPCLQEFQTDGILFLKHLPALVHRSSCPLTKLTLFRDFGAELTDLDDLQLPGVNHIVLETMLERCTVMRKFLLAGCFPELHHLTLRLQPFLSLWEMGVIPLLLDRKRLEPDGPDKGSLSKILVVEPGQTLKFESILKSRHGEKLKALGIRLREDGFEFL